MRQEIKNRKEDKGPFDIVDEPAAFPGGMAAMRLFLRENIQIPEEIVSGKVIVHFVVNENGTVSDVTIKKGIPGCKACDEEAVRVVRSMPPFAPGKINGKNVASYYRLPITFTSN